MNKITHKNINSYQLVDVRNQRDYQAGHLKNSLNFNPPTFKKYVDYFFDLNQAIAFILDSDDKDQLAELSQLAEDLDFTQDSAYLLIDEVPKKYLHTTETVTATDFLNQSTDFILLDVRHPDEITQAGPDKNLINISLENLANNYQSLDRTKQIVTLCVSGNRSTAAASFLESKGFDPKVIEDGMVGFQKNNQ